MQFSTLDVAIGRLKNTGSEFVVRAPERVALLKQHGRIRALQLDRGARIVIWTTSSGRGPNIPFRGHENRVEIRSVHWVLWFYYYLALCSQPPNFSRSRYTSTLGGTESGAARPVRRAVELPLPVVPTRFKVYIGE